jgi:hypothetical protein
VGDVLEPFEFQLYLDLALRRRGQKKKGGEWNAEFHGPLE